jgi:hypothetical protein
MKPNGLRQGEQVAYNDPFQQVLTICLRFSIPTDVIFLVQGEIRRLQHVVMLFCGRANGHTPGVSLVGEYRIGLPTQRQLCERGDAAEQQRTRIEPCNKSSTTRDIEANQGMPVNEAISTVLVEFGPIDFSCHGSP